MRTSLGIAAAKLIESVLAMGIVSLFGCEVIAGIKDVNLTRDAGALGDATSAAPDGDATQNGLDSSVDPGVDVTVQSDASMQPRDSGLAEGEGGNPGADGAPADRTAVDGPATGEAGSVATDAAGDAPDLGDVQSPGDSGAEAGVVGPGVVLVDGDGGALVGRDGGTLLGDLIDDVDSETQPGWILSRYGRVGTWFTYDDGTVGGIVPAPVTASAMPGLLVGTLPSHDGRIGNLAINVQGSGLAAFAGFGFDLKAIGGVKSTYDATAYQGVAFWGRVGADSGTASVRVQLPDRNTAAQGGVCANEAGANGCSDYFAAARTFTAGWQEFVVYFSELRQIGGFGNPQVPSGLDAAHLYDVQFELPRGAAFDIWIDDASFIYR